MASGPRETAGKASRAVFRLTDQKNVFSSLVRVLVWKRDSRTTPRGEPVKKEGEDERGGFVRWDRRHVDGTALLQVSMSCSPVVGWGGGHFAGGSWRAVACRKRRRKEEGKGLTTSRRASCIYIRVVQPITRRSCWSSRLTKDSQVRLVMPWRNLAPLPTRPNLGGRAGEKGSRTVFCRQLRWGFLARDTRIQQQPANQRPAPEAV